MIFSFTLSIIKHLMEYLLHLSWIFLKLGMDVSFQNMTSCSNAGIIASNLSLLL